MPPAEPGLWRRIRQAGGMGGLALAMVLWGGALAMDSWPVDPPAYRLGQYVPRDIHSRVAFRVFSEDRLNEVRRKAADVEPARFRLNTALVDRVLGELKKLPDRMKATSQPADLDVALKAQLGLSDEDVGRVMSAWRAYADPERRETLEGAVSPLRDGLGATAVVIPAEFKMQLRRPGVETVILVAGPRQTTIDLNKLIHSEETDRISERSAALAGGFPPELRASVSAYLRRLLGQEATYVFDKTLTDEPKRRIDRRIRSDPPDECYAVYAVGDRLVPASRHRTSAQAPGMTVQELDLLGREQEAYLGELADGGLAGGLKGTWLTVSRLAGRGGILAMVVALLCVYIGFYQKRIVANRLRGLAVVVTVLLMLGANRIIVAIDWVNPHVSVLPVLIATVIMTIAYTQRFALALGAVLAALVVLQLRAGIEVFILLLVAVFATVYQLDEIRTRSKLIRVLSVSALLVFVTVWSMGVFAMVPLAFISADSIWAALSTVLAGLVAQAILPLVERVFGIATSMTLLEWCDASRPLMRRLAMESPGTHNHSLQLGSMCEAAAEAIGARGLLARVGAYYHDIGKINKPEYFSENEFGSASKHAKLSPAMSLLIIIGHVKDGIELAREYGLPRALHEFIATHHGTTLVQYFYHMAAEQRKGDFDRAPDEVEFRYPGPKPRSKEAGILMLADAAESSVRAMAEPTPGRIENQVHAMVSRRLMDGQLDDCELTLREVHQIETSLIKSLCGVYHSRIAYPTPAGEKPSPAELHPKTGPNGADAGAPANGIRTQEPAPGPDPQGPSDQAPASAASGASPDQGGAPSS